MDERDFSVLMNYAWILFVTHPMFDYRVSYRRLLEIQARLLARFLNSEIDDYPVFVTG
jgi:CRISPR/Cas system-associated endonuclease Cas1